MLSYSINFSRWYQLYIIVPSFCFVLSHNCPFDIQGFATQRLGLFEEVLPPFCLLQEYICLSGQGRDVTLVAAVGSLSHKMDKCDKYNPDEETIEAWLKVFEIRLLCHNIWEADLKRNWCRSLVGEAGNSIIEKLPQSADWTEVKEELCSFLGEGDPKKRAFEALSSYKPKGKGLGEMATDIMAKASLATSDADLQTQLGLKAFLQAVPRNIGSELRRRHFDSSR